MYENFVQKRIEKLRVLKDVSARDMSLSIGQNESYINQIENKKALPSMQAFFYICEYLEITPGEFFDEGNSDPSKLRALIANLKKLDGEKLAHVLAIVEDILSGQ